MIIGEDRIKCYLSKAFIEGQGGYLYKIRERGKTWAYEIEDRKYIVKLNRQIEGLTLNPVKLIRNYLSNVYFKTEIAVLDSLDGTNMIYLGYPRLISTDHKNYLILEFIHGDKGWDENLLGTANVVEAIREFNTLPHNKKTKIELQAVLNMFNGPFLKVIRWCISLLPMKFGLGVSIQTLKTIYRLDKGTQTIRIPFLVHGDLFRRNNILTTKEGISLFDFESSILEHKWILADIIDLATKDDFTFNRNLFWEYIDSLKKDGIELKEAYIKNNVRMILIYRVLCCLVYKKRPVSLNQNDLIAFLTNNLMEDSVYNIWYELNIIGK